MAFKLAPDPTFPLEVDIPKPGQPAEKITFAAKWMSREDFVAYSAAGEGKKDDEFIGGLVVGWDAEDPYSADNLSRLFSWYPQSGREIYRRYRDELLGAEEKN